jgi:outer membrane protein TolC
MRWKALSLVSVAVGLALVGIASAQPPDCETLPIDLPTALRLVNASNPTIALARERVTEADYRLREAEVAWLPDLQAGPAYQRHDGQVQNAAGNVFTTSKSSLFAGGGAALNWDTSNIYFGPLIARQLVNAQAANAQAVTNNVQLDVALAYLDLLWVFAAQAVNADTLRRAEEMLQNAEAAEKSGLGKTPADVTRARSEVNLRRVEAIDLQGQAAVVSARLARLLLLKPTVDLQPADPNVVPVSLVPPETCLDDLVALGLRNRPELRESQSFVEAALARWQQAKVTPFLPRLQVSYSSGLFGGGRDSDMSNFNGRGDGTAMAVWELRNLGAGDVARARARRSQYNQATLNVVEVQAEVAEEVTAAAKLVRTRLATLSNAQIAVREALETWRRLRAGAFGLADPRYSPLEPLIAVRDLDQARTHYLAEVIEYNKAQFRLYWALGQPVLCATSTAIPIATEVPVVPAPKPEPAELPQPRPLNEPKK